jgi:hypothetical protein
MATAAMFTRMGRDRMWTAVAGRSFVVAFVAMTAIGVTFTGLDEGLSVGVVVRTLVLAVFLAGVNAALLARQARRELAEVAPPGSGPDEAALARALRTGTLPDDPRLHESVRRLVARRRSANGRRPLVVPAVMMAGAVVMAIGAALRGDAGFAGLAGVLAASAVIVAVLLVRDFRRYDRLDAALGDLPGPA